MLARTIDLIQRREGGRILAGLIRHCGDISLAEDVLQEAYARACIHWRDSGLPDNPAAWLSTVARNAATDLLRAASNLQSQHSIGAEGERDAFEHIAAPETYDPAIAVASMREAVDDDMLRLIFTCCHPALPQTAQTALALKTICQLSVTEIARAYLEPETTTQQRLVRAKRKIAEAKIAYAIPEAADLQDRLETVLGVIYLVFNEGYTAAQSSQLMRAELCIEAIRLARLLHTLMTNHKNTSAEIAGLLALMLLTHARRDARTDSTGDLVPLAEQDRTRWDRTAIDEAIQLLDSALLFRTPGVYQIEAAIAALHAQAKSTESTDWEQISALYGALWRRRPTDIVALNAAVAHAMAFSIDEGLSRIEKIVERGQLAGYHLLHAARADLQRRQNNFAAARTAYTHALTLTQNAAERRYLQKRITEMEAAIDCR
jgi:RNA polymerase sigma-70 factor, ECF subfamily